MPASPSTLEDAPSSNLVHLLTSEISEPYFNHVSVLLQAVSNLPQEATEGGNPQGAPGTDGMGWGDSRFVQRFWETPFEHYLSTPTSLSTREKKSTSFVCPVGLKKTFTRLVKGQGFSLHEAFSAMIRTYNTLTSAATDPSTPLSSIKEEEQAALSRQSGMGLYVSYKRARFLRRYFREADRFARMLEDSPSETRVKLDGGQDGLAGSDGSESESSGVTFAEAVAEQDLANARLWRTGFFNATARFSALREHLGQNGEDEVKTVGFQCPPAEHARFKDTAKEQGFSMNEILVAMLALYVTSTRP